MKRKLTTVEKRAESLCRIIKSNTQQGESFTIAIEWKNSRMWGANPVIMSLDGKCTNVSGCGYCKESTALADCLQFLAEDEEGQNKIARLGGTGVSNFMRALPEIVPYVIEAGYCGKVEHVYTIRQEAK